jgi:hypothetical protein
MFFVSVIDRFWQPMIGSPRPVLICAGMPLDTNWDSPGSQPLPDHVTLGSSIHTSDQRVMIDKEDLSGADQIAAFMRSKGKNAIVRPIEGTDLASLKSDPIILYGMYLNEWAFKLGADLHFRFRKDPNVDFRWIEEKDNSSDRKWSATFAGPEEKNNGSDFALISRIQDQATGRWWIGFSGLTRAGTLAASQLVLDPKSMAAIGPGLPKGWDKKNLQIVLEVKVAQGNPGAARVVATYAW